LTVFEEEDFVYKFVYEVVVGGHEHGHIFFLDDAAEEGEDFLGGVGV
jgi:hypothetical protein